MNTYQVHEHGWLAKALDDVRGARPCAVRLTGFSVLQAIQDVKDAAAKVTQPVATLAGHSPAFDVGAFTAKLAQAGAGAGIAGCLAALIAEAAKYHRAMEVAAKIPPWPPGLLTLGQVELVLAFT